MSLMSLMSIKDLITSDPYYQNSVKPRGFPTGNDVYVPPTTPTPTPTPEPGIPSIVNPYLPFPYIPPNQGGGEGDGNVVNDYKDYGYTGLGSSDSPIGFNIDDIGEGTIDDEDMPGIFEQLSNLNIQTPGKFALDLINKGITDVGDYFANRKAEKIAEEKAAFDKAEKERIAKEAIAEAQKIEAARIEAQKAQKAREAATAQRAREANASVYASADRQGFTDGRGGGFGSRSTGTNDAFGNKSGRGRTGYRYGGRASYFDGGIASMFSRRR